MGGGRVVAVGFALSATLSALVNLTSASTRYVSPIAHAIDLALTSSIGVALGVTLAVGQALLTKSRLSAAARRWAGRAAFVGLHALVVVAALGDFAERRAHALALYPLVVPARLLLLAAFALAPLAVVGLARALLRPRPGPSKTRARLARSGRWLALLLALGAATLNGRVFRADLFEVHGAGVWLVALWLAEIVDAWSGPSLPPSRRAWIVTALAGVALVAVALVPPSNHVRLLVLRSPTALGANVFAALTWPAPRLPASFTAPMEEPDAAAAPGPRFADAPLVVLVTIDSLRADVLLGGLADSDPRPSAPVGLPNFEAIARESVVFTNAHAAAGDSVGSLSSLFASRPRSSLAWSRRGEGVLHGDYPAEDPSPRVASILDARGVVTTSLVSAQLLAGELGVARGFADERLLAHGRARALAPVVMRALLDALADVDERPQLVFAHFTDAHAPYSAPGASRSPPRERYLRALAEIDRQLGELREALAASGLADRVVLIVAGDHGEAFGEHGPIGRDKPLYEEALRVPLLVRASGLRAHAVGEPVSLLDVGPTVLAVFGAPVPGEFMGETLAPLLAGERFRRRSRLVAESRTQRVIFEGTLKAILDTRKKTLEIFDLERDPREVENLFPGGLPGASRR